MDGKIKVKCQPQCPEPIPGVSCHGSTDDLPGEVISFPMPENGAADINGGGFAAPGEVPLNEDDIAKHFATAFHHKLRFDHSADLWFLWNGTHWKQNKTEIGFDFARLFCREHRAGQSRMATKKAAEAVEHMARRDQRLAVTSDIWDREPLLLGTPGGTVDLRTGILIPPNPLSYISKITRVAPALKGSACPVFMKFLGEATGGDAELQRFLQLWAGYCLTGRTDEQALLFIYGTGGNGKGVFVKVMTEILGDYAISAAMETFLASKHQRHPTELAMLQGARLVTASELEINQAWSESRINQLTGEDPITARYMHKDHFTYLSQFKLMLIGNHKPKLASVNEAARRRFNIVPFPYKPKVPDKTLMEKLRKEYDAILRWMIDGCLDWQEIGLVRPKIVSETTEQYFSDQDLVAQWIEECCEVGPGKGAAAKVLFTSWSDYMQANGEAPGTSTSFGIMLNQRGYERKKSGAIRYIGIQPKPVSSMNFSDP